MRARRFLWLAVAAAIAASPAAAQRWGGRGGGFGGGRGRMGPPAATRGWDGGGYGGRGYGGRQGGGFGGYGGGEYGGGRGGGGRWGGGYGGFGPAGGGGPQAFAPQRPAQAYRRGQIVPQGYRGARVDDPGRYHLRGAPNGYDWLGDGRDAYLVQRSTGMVMDSAPGAYQGPGPGRGRWGGRGGPRF